MRGIAEDECLEKLGKSLGAVFEAQSRYCPLDGITEGFCCEIKQRNLRKDTFPSTIIGKNKIDYWKENHPEKELYFFVRFRDGDYFYKWNATDNIPVNKGGLKDNPRDYYYVPVELLTRLI